MKPAFRRGRALLDDIAQARRHAAQLHLWWLGQSGFLIAYADRCLLIDPYLSDSLTRKYHGTEKPHVRVSEQVIEPAELRFVDLVTSSHNHTDHLDAETLAPLLAEGVTMLVPAANQAFAAERLGVPRERLTPIDAGQSQTLAGFEVHALPAAHEQLDRDDQGRYKHLGYVFGCGGWRVYHSGDCVPYDGLAERLRSWPIDVALLPINGRDPKRGVPGNFSGEEAAELARDIGAQFAVPCHYDLFAFNTVSPEAFERRCGELGQAFRTLRLGEGWSSEGLSPRSRTETPR